MGLAHEKKSYLQEKANLFEIGPTVIFFWLIKSPIVSNAKDIKK